MIFRDDALPSDFAPGQNVRVHPGTNLWLSGIRFGVVHKVGRKWVHICAGMKTWPVLPRNLSR